jgi:hypothetical protein
MQRICNRAISVPKDVKNSQSLLLLLLLFLLFLSVFLMLL